MKQPEDLLMNLPFKFPHQIFRAYDIRGKVELLNPSIVQAIATALVYQLQKMGQTQIVIGYDARLSSPTFAKIIEQVFLQHHFKVISIGCCATPQMYFAARQTQGNGIMVTASHNAKTDNGIKWIIQSEPPSPEMIQDIGKLAAQLILTQPQVVEYFPVPHQLEPEFSLAYQAVLLQDIQLKRPFKVVLDGLNGSAGDCAQQVLQKLGCEVIALRCNADGHFPDHAPDPSQAKHLERLQQQILQHQADLGIALDGDGDRVVLLDEHARIVSADRLLCLYAQLCLAEHPQHEIVFDVKCSAMVRQVIEQLGGQAKMLRTGSSFLRRYLSQSNGLAVFGGEYAGHYVFNDGRGLGYDDGLYAALRVLEYLSQSTNQSLSEVLAVYPERFYTQDTYISTHGIDLKNIVQEIQAVQHDLDAVLSHIDGVRLDFAYGFGIIRASNTGEFFTIRFDADSAAHLDKIRQTFASILSARYPMLAQDILHVH